MKKRVIFLIVTIVTIVMILLLTSCGFIADPSGTIEYVRSGGEGGKIKQMSTDILNCFTNNDQETFKKLFSEQVQNSSGFDEQVDKTFEYCNGTVYFTDHTINTTASGGSGKQDGKFTYWNVNPEIPYFKVLTEVGSGETEFRHYFIFYSWHIINESDKTQEGLQNLKIELLNVDSMVIGERRIQDGGQIMIDHGTHES